MDASLKSIKEAFKPAYDEIERRKNADTTEQMYFEKSEKSTNLKERIPDQEYMLFSISSEGIPPLSTKPNNPAVKIYGCFASEEDAKEHALEIVKVDNSCSLFINKTNQWAVAASSISRMQDETLIANVVTDRLKEYLKVRMEDNKEFDETVKKNEVERTVKPEYEEEPIVRNEKSRSHKTKVGLEVRGQKFAVIVFLPDPVTGEPIFIVYGCLESQEEADTWVRNVLCRKVTEYDIHVVSTCEWLFLNRMRGDGAQSHKYRTPELEKIMEAQRNAPEQIKEYEEMYGHKNEPETKG